MKWEVLDYEPESRVTTWHGYDHETDTTSITETQDVSHILERAKQLRNNEDYSKRGIKQEWWHVATFPIIVQYQWLRLYGVDTMKWGRCPETTRRIKRLLRDPEWKYLTTTTGKL